MNSSMFCWFNVYNVVEKPSRVHLPGTYELSTFICEPLVFKRHTLANKEPSRKF